ncbi:Glycosyl transferases group 1 [Pseudarthrobacter enclensis]|uniref:D-inositol 3-phosphate glycosyltransferase n=1 Tax=Pseudarthrobacter enclensis TaxID=993070 RepID=A0A0V8IGZ0_9MICC|nr:glycosyltransferase family 4 protein [Pseudarthrobacter enclensis]KSU74052.1 glycosyl transferase [Pseudarthrobacter enclensis]SCC21704.1 Glycosyl transferases group 1 [Pseudarthrobacter enclensis]
MRILLWHVHGSWTDAFVRGRHEYLLPVLPEGGAWGLGRAGRNWPASVREVDLAALDADSVDAVVLQRPEEIGEVTRILGRTPGRDLPAVFVEHNTPKGDFPFTRHPLADQHTIPIVHVTHFNRLAWDNGSAVSTVIEHGIPDPGHLYTGELPDLGVVVNEPVRRGRVTGTDLLPAFASVAPLQVFGMKTEGLAVATGIPTDRLTPRGDLKTAELHRELARCRVYVHPMRWTSLGLSLLEAMHLGMPVVALAATEAPRAVPAEAGAVSADIDELLRCARRLVANPEEARRRGAAAREAALERYGLGRFQDSWDQLLADLGSSLSATHRPEERILVPARERKTP